MFKQLMYQPGRNVFKHAQKKSHVRNPPPDHFKTHFYRSDFQNRRLIMRSEHADLCAGQKALLWSSAGSPSQPIKTHFPALIGLEGRGSQSGYCIGLAHSGCSLSGPRLCHVSGRAISSLALRSALRPKETAFWGSEGCRALWSAVERLRHTETTDKPTFTDPSDTV